MGFWSKVGNALVGGLDDSPDPSKARYGDHDYVMGQAQQGIANAQGRQAPQADRTRVGQVATGNAAQINTQPQHQFRSAQRNLLGQLQGVANGQQAGAGELAVNRQTGQALAAQQALARSTRGGNAALAMRGAARNAGDIGVAGAGQAQMAALQDQAAARGLIANVAGQGREQDIGLATGQAGLQQQMRLQNLSAENQRIFQQAGLDQATSLANMQARLQQTGMNDAAVLGYLQAITGMDAAELAARMGQEQTAMNQQGLLPGLLGAGGQVAAAAAGAG